MNNYAKCPKCGDEIGSTDRCVRCGCYDDGTEADPMEDIHDARSWSRSLRMTGNDVEDEVAGLLKRLSTRVTELEKELEDERARIERLEEAVDQAIGTLLQWERDEPAVKLGRESKDAESAGKAYGFRNAAHLLAQTLTRYDDDKSDPKEVKPDGE